jgi:integrase
MNNTIEKYVKDNYKTKSTQVGYKYLLNTYFNIIGKKPEGYLKNKKNTKQYEKDIKKVFNHLLEKNTPPLTIRTYISAIRTYLMVQGDIELKKSWWKANITNKMPGKRPRTRDTVPERHELKQILQHADCRGRAFFLTLSSSGMRIGELCKITPEEIHFNKKPVEIDVLGEYTKVGDRRLCYITDEAANALKEWLKIRQQYLNDIAKNAEDHFTHYTVNTKDPRVFPFRPDTGREMWKKYIKNAGFDDKDQSTKRFQMHPHVLRKLYISTMKQYIPVAMVDKITGHTGYLSMEYDRFSDKELAQKYLEQSGHLTIFETVKEQDLTSFNDRLKEKDDQMRTMQETLEEMKAQIVELRLEKLEKQNGITSFSHNRKSR